MSSFPLPSDDVLTEAKEAAPPPQLLLMPGESSTQTQTELHIDALPYIDNEYNDPEIKARVHQLITAEMQASPLPLSSYFASLSSLPSLASLPSFQAGYKSPASIHSPLSTAHLSCFPSPPPSLSSSSPPYPLTPDLTSPSSLSLHVSLLTSSSLSHDILRHFGPQQQTLIGQHLRSRREVCKAELEKEVKRIENVNRERKRRQEEVAEKLRFSEGEWWRLLNNVQGIQDAISNMQQNKKSRLT